MRSKLAWAVAAACVAMGMESGAQVAPDPVNLSALWMDQSEAGYGVLLAHQGDMVFTAWYTYGADGKVLWMIAPVSRQSDGSYRGPIDRFTGIPFNQIDNAQAWTTTERIGEARLNLLPEGKLDFGYTIGTINQNKRLERLDFSANPPTCTFTTASRAGASNYTDVWWNPAESGWGLSLMHQGELIFIAWYTYAANGAAQWITGLATRQPDGSFSGELNRPESGTPFDRIDGPATTFPVPTVGSFRFEFQDGERGIFAYTLDGISQTKPIERLVYMPAGTPLGICAEPSGGGGGPLAACDPGLQVGDFRTAQILGGDRVTERVAGTGSFQGQNVLIMEQFDGSEQLTNRYYMQVTATELLTLGNEAIQNGQVMMTTVFNPPAKFIRAPAIGERYTHNYTATSTGPGLNFTSQYSETIERKADAQQSVPAGSFNSCVFDRRITTTTFGISTQTDMDLWIAPEVGTVRTDARSQTPAGITNTDIRLLRARVNGVDFGE